MGLQWERDQRQQELQKAVLKAYSVAMRDALSEYDDLDYERLRKEYLQWDVPKPELPLVKERAQWSLS